MINTYYIGGSPCSGKSTIAELISKEYGYYYFKVDDFLDKYMQLATSKGYPVCQKISGMNPEQIWMREPRLQCREELLIYEEIFEFICRRFAADNRTKGISTNQVTCLVSKFRK